jgi:hypothetical protein
VVKPRFSAGGRGFALVRDWGELCELMHRAKSTGKELMIQEYIPGQRRSSCHIVLDKKGILKLAFRTVTLRNFTREEFSTVVQSMAPDSVDTTAANLLRALGWWGGATVQMKIDTRNDVAKLMEINPRPGIRLWHRTELGINEPLLSINIARGKQTKAVTAYPEPTLLVEPIEDFLGVGYKLFDLGVYRLSAALSSRPQEALRSPLSITDLINAYRVTYFNGHKRVNNPYFRYFFTDPLVSILWWLQFLGIAWRYAGQLGK